MLTTMLVDVVMQGYLYMSKYYGVVGSDLKHVMLWRNLVWLPLFIGAWGLVGHILHIHL